ncbi:ABC transporter ATP-binding protein [Wenyingzhuangia sp. IMCC45533]
MVASILKIENLNKSYGNKSALKDVSLNINRGSIYGLIGQNGAGKTTLIRILNKIIDADGGSIHFNGNELNTVDVQKIGYLPEERGLYKNMSIEEQALYFGQLKGMSKKSAADQLNYWLQKFDILDWKKKKIESLSKGMAQKVQFIITVLHQPSLIILDEPFSGLDPVNAEFIAKEIKFLASEGKTIIFSSHRMESVTDMCNEISLIHKGRILLQGGIKEIQELNANQVYHVVLELDNVNMLDSLKIPYRIIQQENQELTLEVVSLNIDNNTLIKQFAAIGNIKSYKQHVPTLQEIFIKTIANA